MSSVYSEMADVTSAMAKDICQNEKTEKFISGAASKAVGAVAGAVTASPAVGFVTEATASGLSRSHSKEVAEAATSVALGAAISVASIAASIVLVPALLVGFIFRRS